MTTHEVSKNHTRVEVAFPMERLRATVAFDVATNRLDEAQRDAIQQIVQSLDADIKFLVLADDIKRMALREAAVGRSRVGGFMTRCENIINRVTDVLPRKKGSKFVAFESFAKRPR